MTKEELKEHLFSKVARVFAVLDGASIPELRTKIHQMKPINHCLLSGDLEPDMQEVAPYLVRLLPNTPFTEWLLEECSGKHWGIFAQTRDTVIEMRKHFTELVDVYDEAGNPMTFRYYDPRVFRKFLPTCENEQLEAIFGKVDTYFAESENGENLIRFELINGEVKETEL